MALKFRNPYLNILAPVLNFLSLIFLSGGYFYVLLQDKRTGIEWYSVRIAVQGDNHLAIFLILGVLLVGLSILLVRNPFKSIHNGFFRVIAESLAFFALTSDLWLFSFDINNLSSRVTEWVYLTPMCILILMLTVGRPYGKTLRRMGLFVLLVVPYLGFWSLYGFHTTMAFSLPTIYYNDFWTNIWEIGYWAWSSCMFLLSILPTLRASEPIRDSQKLTIARQARSRLTNVVLNWRISLFAIVSFILALIQVSNILHSL